MKTKGYLCPVCKTYSIKETTIKKLGKGWLLFQYGCGHSTKERPKSIGQFRVLAKGG